MIKYKAVFRNTFLLALFLISTNIGFSQKQIYIPRFITNTGMDLNDCSSQWCYDRSVETENWIIFWEAGFGDNPATATGTYRIDMENLKEVAEWSFSVNLNVLKMAIEGNSVTDTYKQMIFLLYTPDWAAYGSGADDMVGCLHVNPAAANNSVVVAHEIGHCFQYITACDSDGGFRYGFGNNGAGGNGFWEQCAQWQAFKTYPNEQFTTHNFNSYLAQNHLHIIHEAPRYDNYFLPDFWAFKRGIDFIGRLWREARYPEDPVEAYKRINSITQEQFNDEMYEHAARLTTWDLPAIKYYGQNYIHRRTQVSMKLDEEEYWVIDYSKCIQNYGYNSIKLNAPSSATQVSVNFRGMAGADGYRAINIDNGGWKYGFVALLNDGTRVYSNVATANVENGVNPEGTLSFDCPDNCEFLWLVVSGSPQEYWRHEWDDDESNDEQWPYKVQFENTNLLGIYSNPIHDITLTYDVVMQPRSDYSSVSIGLNPSRICEAFSMSQEDIARAFGTSIIYHGINSNGQLNSTSTANHPGHWYDRNSAIVNWGGEAYVFSELNINQLVANIGQYPDRCELGDEFTIRQALVYQKSATERAEVTLIFNIKIQEEFDEQSISFSEGWNLFSFSVVPDNLEIRSFFSQLDIEEVKTDSQFWRSDLPDFLNSLTHLQAGHGYLVRLASAGTLILQGTFTDAHDLMYDSNISGWQLVGMPFPSSVQILDAFNSYDTEIIKTYTDYWSALRVENTLQTIEPGQAYFVK